MQVAHAGGAGACLPALGEVVVYDDVVCGRGGGLDAIGALKVLIYRVRAAQIPELVGAAHGAGSGSGTGGWVGGAES